MKKLSERINEMATKNDAIDDEWINNDKPVKTEDGRQVIVTKVDMTKVPNIIIGQVKMQSKLFDYEWDENGKCTKASDQYGNPKKPTDSDNLVKA